MEEIKNQKYWTIYWNIGAPKKSAIKGYKGDNGPNKPITYLVLDHIYDMKNENLLRNKKVLFFCILTSDFTVYIKF